MRADDVLEHAQDVNFEFFDARPFEHRPADADHAGTDFVDAHLRALCRDVNQGERSQE
jgi:hypothetical protein